MEMPPSLNAAARPEAAKVKRPKHGCLVTTLIGVAALVVVGVWLWHSSTFILRQPLTLAASRQCKHIALPLPATATNIWVYYNAWAPGAYKYRLRFDAPPADCIAYANLVMTNKPAEMDEWKKITLPTPAACSDPFGYRTLDERLLWSHQANLATDLKWYGRRGADAEHGEVSATLNIDRSRGIFYYSINAYTGGFIDLAHGVFDTFLAGHNQPGH